MDIAVIGSNMVDLITYTNQMPKEGGNAGSARLQNWLWRQRRKPGGCRSET